MDYTNSFDSLLFFENSSKIPVIISKKSLNNRNTIYNTRINVETNYLNYNGIDCFTIANNLISTYKPLDLNYCELFEYGSNELTGTLSYLNDTSLLLSTNESIEMDYIYPTYLKCLIDSTIVIFTKIYSIKKIDNTDYLITIEGLPSFANSKDISIGINDITNIEISIAEPIQKIGYIDENDIYPITKLRSHFYENNNVILPTVIFVETGYDILNNKIIMNTAGNKVSNRKTLFSTTYVELSELSDLNVNYVFENKNDRRYKNLSYNQQMPEIENNSDYKMYTSMYFRPQHSLAERGLKSEQSITITNPNYNLAQCTLICKVNGIDCDYSIVGSESNDTIIFENLTISRKHNNNITAEVIYKNQYSMLTTSFLIYNDYLVPTPIAEFDFVSMESLKNVTNFNVSSSFDKKQTTNKYNSNNYEIINKENTITFVDNLFDENGKSRSKLDKIDNLSEFRLIDVNSKTSFIRLFGNCVINNSSNSEQDEVNNVNYTILFDKEIKYNSENYDEMEII